ncbi:DNA-binding MarR family transcriptional regulator [Okibacterium sp. HSC-33S16]|uniref:MarR family winged helix-turn-helix transcriptional regulator n=1 Tax=Okibacterium sp. HSC-33S16 TaxID=2910965 RepID=UPI00209D9CD3|nr:MarR family transcriptional regulator [Okibacterium sp. HSC-33S16]MCP2032680.1 DNA-binding MarR family transcriptional regulator [Okibacterium sp. HSC-33S16]
MQNAPAAAESRALDSLELAVALMDISADVRRKSHEGTGVPVLSNAAFDIVRVVESNPGITVAELAARLGRQLSNVSTQLKELVIRGLITRRHDPADKRYVALHPTAESLGIKTVLETAWSDAVSKAAAQLSDEERDQIQASIPALRHLAEVLGRDADRSAS